MLGRPKREFSPIFVAPLFAAFLAVGCVATPAAAATPGTGALTPELAKLGTAAVAAQPAPAQAEAIGLPTEGPGSLAREGERVIVEAHFEGGALAGLEALKAAGAKILAASREYQTVALSVEPEDLEALAAVPGLSTVAASRRPVFYGAEAVLGTAGTAAVQSNGLCEGGSVISQGLAQLNVPAARAAFGARGAGETIGVISDSFNSATTSIAGGPIATNAHGDEVSNDLPGRASTCSGQQVPVNVIAEAPPGGPEEASTDEGRAMLQIVHDLAPHAQLAFATAYSTELEFARNIERLAEPVAVGGAGADVIVDDVSYFTEPFFQEGPVAVAIQKVTAAGATYLTSAGNDNLFSKFGTEIASWEAPEFRPMSCPKAIKAPSSCMNFSPGIKDSTFGITVEAEEPLIVDLQWAEPWYGVETDLDAYLLDSAGNVIADEPIVNYKSGEGAVPMPIELLDVENKSSKAEEVQLVIACASCDSEVSSPGPPRLKFAMLENGRGVSGVQPLGSVTEREAAGIVVGPTIYGHAGSPAAITLGAVKYTESASAPKEPERYSSRGPVTHYFGPVVGITPAGELAQPEEIAKPNLTASDCASTTFFARVEEGAYHFCGTSEAAPHAAAVAALMKQTDPLATPGEIVAAMEESATKYTTVKSTAAVGAGLLKASAAIAALGGSPVNDPPSSVVASLEKEETEEKHPAESVPVVTITKGPKALGNDRRPTFEFTSNRSVAFTCQVDGGAAQACSSPYVVPTLTDGAHGFSVTATDAKGGSAGSGVYAFTVDTKAPKTKIVGHPKKVIKTRKRNVVAHFKLKASEAPVIFYCEIDREAQRVCGKIFHRRFKLGKHVLKVRAKDGAGNLATKWTVFQFQVKKLRRAPRAS
jgi:Subtilase family